MAKASPEQRAKWKATGKKLADAGRPKTKAAIRRNRLCIFLGLALVVLGLAATVLTYLAASGPEGGTYFVAYGPVIGGTVLLGKGLAGEA